MQMHTTPPPQRVVGSVVLANARVVLPDEVVTGSVEVQDGRITAIDQAAGCPAGAVDCEGDFVAPGLIELHTDNLERHMQPRPAVKWPKDAAIIAHDAELASVGIATVFDAMRIGSIVSKRKSKYGAYAREMSRAMLDARARGALRISHFLHLRAEVCSETLAAEFAEFGPDDRVGIVSLMDHTPGQRQFADTAQLRTYLSGKYGMGEAEMDAHIAFQQKIGRELGPDHQTLAVRRAGELGAILASHDDTTLEHVNESLEFGVQLAEFPTTMEAARATHEAGIAVMMGAPNLLRGGSHSGNVAAKDLAESGLLDILSSDYAPSSLLSAAVQLGDMAGNMAKGLRAVTAAPADAAKLADRGRVAVGQRGDFVRFTTRYGHPVTRGLWVQGVRVA
jgi:alpha-D-ribose 1-methylphosphonate 5-triphosphate diphosphatase